MLILKNKNLSQIRIFIKTLITNNYNQNLHKNNFNQIKQHKIILKIKSLVILKTLLINRGLILKN